mmetsp:Transcript_27496/g.46158  ORF Transcript_27496/g.46158 Transcript_27496/m.46158 type:complete len:86 (+) Transcript_27496:1430-1687(+)
MLTAFRVLLAAAGFFDAVFGAAAPAVGVEGAPLLADDLSLSAGAAFAFSAAATNDALLVEGGGGGGGGGGGPVAFASLLGSLSGD